jgi:gluconolactonase
MQRRRAAWAAAERHRLRRRSHLSPSLDDSALGHETIFVSAGQRGRQMAVASPGPCPTFVLKFWRGLIMKRRRFLGGSLVSLAVLVLVLAAISPARTADDPSAGQSKVRIAGIVLKWVRGDKEANYRRAEPLIREAARNKAQIVITTECFLDGYAIADKTIPLADYRALGEPIFTGAYFKRLTVLAAELKIHLVAGMTEADGEARYNTAVLFGPDGKLLGKYRKQKLGHETVRNTAGEHSPVHSTKFGQAAMMICADRTDADLVQRFRTNGADFLLCPSGGMFGPKNNDPIVQARSKETRLPIVFVHPAEFLVTAPDGSIVERTLLGDVLLVTREEVGGPKDENKVCYVDLPLATAADEDIIPRDAKVEKAASGCKFTEGPAADAEGNLFFTDGPRGFVMVLRPDGKLDVWDKKSQDANGMRFDTKGRLVACCGEDGARAVLRYEKDGTKTVLADKYNGTRLTAPNDLTIDRQGRIYFTDPCYGRRPKDGQEKYAVYRIDARDGEPVPNQVTRVIDDVDTPNGICISPDQKTLYVADNAARKNGPHTLIAYDIAADGTCKRRAVVHDFKERRGIDGMVVDTQGNIYATAEDGGQDWRVHLFAGRQAARLLAHAGNRDQLHLRRQGPENVVRHGRRLSVQSPPERDGVSAVSDAETVKAFGKARRCSTPSYHTMTIGQVFQQRD